MKTLKYIIASHNGAETVTLFSPEMVHYAMGVGIRESAIWEGEGNWSNEFLSAGFAYISPDGKVAVGGESESMHLKARPEDADIIKRHLFGLFAE